MTARLPQPHAQPSLPTDLEARLAAIERTQQLILAEIRALQPPAPPPTDAEKLAQLLAATHAALGADAFTVSKLFRITAGVDPKALALCGAINAIVGQRREDDHGRKLGHFLGAYVGRTASGLRLAHAGRHRDGHCYRVERV